MNHKLINTFLPILIGVINSYACIFAKLEYHTSNSVIYCERMKTYQHCTMKTQSEPSLNDKKFFPPTFERNVFLSILLLMHSNVCQAQENYSLGSSTLPLGSQRGLFSIMVYGKGGTSQVVKSSFLGTLQLLKSSFLSRAKLLMLPGGLPGLTLYPAALVVPRGLPGLVLNPAARVVPSGRPVLVR